MQATVKYQAREPKDYGHGPRINVVITLPDGTEQKLWGNADDQYLAKLRKGQKVEVFTDKKGNLQLDASTITAQPVPIQQTAPAAAGSSIAGFCVPDASVRQNMLEYIEFSGDLFKHCFNVANEKLQEVNLPDSDLRAVATTLYLSTARRFDLQ